METFLIFRYIVLSIEVIALVMMEGVLIYIAFEDFWVGISLEIKSSRQRRKKLKKLKQEEERLYRQKYKKEANS